MASKKTKTIKINPELFSMSPKKTVVNKTVKKRTNSTPTVRPNKLKKKLLERIKTHQTNNEQKVVETENVTSDDTSYQNEFYDSMKYLSHLADEKNQNSPYKKNKRNSTRKKINHAEEGMHVDLELPNDLKETNGPILDSHNIAKQHINIPQNTTDGNDKVAPPYGCLKGGQKPTYRTWNKTQKKYNVDYSSNNIPSSIPTNTTSPTTNGMRLQQLKETFKQKHTPKYSTVPTNDLVQAPEHPPQITVPPVVTMPDKILTDTSLQNTVTTNADNIVISNNDEPKQLINTIIPTIPKRTKKTTTRKYQLGKGKKQRTVGVLIKDRKTRKNILNAQKEIKRKNMNEVKQYLYDHGLLRAGSTAPNEVVRKMYESSMLSGEVTNNDNDILTHNMMSKHEDD